MNPITIENGKASWTHQAGDSYLATGQTMQGKRVKVRSESFAHVAAINLIVLKYCGMFFVCWVALLFIGFLTYLTVEILKHFLPSVEKTKRIATDDYLK